MDVIVPVKSRTSKTTLVLRRDESQQRIDGPYDFLMDQIK